MYCGFSWGNPLNIAKRVLRTSANSGCVMVELLHRLCARERGSFFFSLDLFRARVSYFTISPD
jgi:hypothetical protein